MYDELVKRLMYCRNNAAIITAEELVEIADETADATEELSRAQEQWITQERNALLKSIPRWVPVTERLPEDGSLVGKLIADSDGNIRIASQCAEITLSGGKTVYTDLIDLVSLLAEDTPTTKWEDCTHITHWMPLPEPPKEEANGA